MDVGFFIKFGAFLVTLLISALSLFCFLGAVVASLNGGVVWYMPIISFGLLWLALFSHIMAGVWIGWYLL